MVAMAEEWIFIHPTTVLPYRTQPRALCPVTGEGILAHCSSPAFQPTIRKASTHQKPQAAQAALVSEPQLI